MNPPKDETNHVFYKAWKDKGGNIGVQCSWEECSQPTFWTGQEPLGKILTPVDPMDITKGVSTKDCLNCQAMKTLNVLKIENDRHTSEASEETCSHLPSQI